MTSLPEQPPRPRLRGNVHYLETQFSTRLRTLVIWEAKQQARQEVIRRLKAEGLRVSLMAASTITSLANAHLRAHAAELLAAAEQSGVVRNLRLEHERSAADLKAKSLSECHVQNGEPK